MHIIQANRGDYIRKSQELTSSVLLLQDNAPAHTSQVVMTSATESGFEILPHPPYSPVIAPSDFYPFPKLKSHLHGIQYGSNEIDIEAVNITEGTRKGPSILKG